MRISPASGGKVQAVGIDNRSRLQYIYHSRFVEAQQRKKFAKIERFGEYLPHLRRITNEHISLKGFPLEKVLAIMTRLINLLYIRMGTDRSVKQFRTFGITTLGNRHVTVSSKGKVVFEFVGKSRIMHKKVLVDRELGLLIKQLSQLGRGRKLFQYLDDEDRFRPIKPLQLNAYIKSITAPEYSAKDFRTWGATMLAATNLAKIGVTEDEVQIQKNIAKVIKNVAAELGNTPSVCRSSYIHPAIIAAYSKGVVLGSSRVQQVSQARLIEEEFESDEIALLELFRQYH